MKVEKQEYNVNFIREQIKVYNKKKKLRRLALGDAEPIQKLSSFLRPLPEAHTLTTLEIKKLYDILNSATTTSGHASDQVFTTLKQWFGQDRLKALNQLYTTAHANMHTFELIVRHPLPLLMLNAILKIKTTPCDTIENYKLLSQAPNPEQEADKLITSISIFDSCASYSKANDNDSLFHSVEVFAQATENLVEIKENTDLDEANLSDKENSFKTIVELKTDNEARSKEFINPVIETNQQSSSTVSLLDLLRSNASSNVVQVEEKEALSEDISTITTDLEFNNPTVEHVELALSANENVVASEAVIDTSEIDNTDHIKTQNLHSEVNAYLKKVIMEECFRVLSDIKSNEEYTAAKNYYSIVKEKGVGILWPAIVNEVTNKVRSQYDAFFKTLTPDETRQLFDTGIDAHLENLKDIKRAISNSSFNSDKLRTQTIFSFYQNGLKAAQAAEKTNLFNQTKPMGFRN